VVVFLAVVASLASFVAVVVVFFVVEESAACSPTAHDAQSIAKPNPKIRRPMPASPFSFSGEMTNNQ
jgi:hypothetical protein